MYHPAMAAIVEMAKKIPSAISPPFSLLISVLSERRGERLVWGDGEGKGEGEGEGKGDGEGKGERQDEDLPWTIVCH